MHFAAASRQKLHLQKELGTCQSLELPTHSHYASPPDTAQDLSLLLSATTDWTVDTEIVAMLLGAGFSTQCRLHLFRDSPTGPVRSGQTISLWVVWLVHFSYGGV